MPTIKLDPTSKGLVQESGTQLKLFKGSQSITANASADGAVIDIDSGPVVNVTSGNAAHIVHLPAISSDTVGLTYLVHVGANGFELRGNAEASDLLNSASGGANVELAVEANSTVMCVCTSSTNWAVVGPHGASVAS